MKKRGKKINFFKVFLVIIILIALVHISISFIAPLDKGITEKVSLSPEKLKDNYIALSQWSKLIIAGEWLLVILTIIYILIKGKMKADKEMQVSKDLKDSKKEIKYKKSRSETDLDVLHNILKKKKSLRLSSVSKLFGINKDTAMNWCKILEEGNLATIHYPTVGDPKIIINEENKEKGENEENKE